MMRSLTRLIALSLILSGVVSCGDKTQQAGQMPQKQVFDGRFHPDQRPVAAATPVPAPQPGAKPGPATPKGSEAGDMPVPPKGARWTIYCMSIREVTPGDNVIRANQIKNELMRTTGMNGWYVIHESGASTLYYGFYRSVNDPKDSKETARAKADRERIDQFTTADGERPFKTCIFVDLNAPDPQAPPEWDLRNAQGTWSIQIGAYRDHPDRKQAAVDAVREARAQGIPAYYFHGETTSSVCVGAWPEGAVQRPDEVRSASEEQSILVLPGNIPFSDAQLRQAKDSRGRMKVVREGLQVLDPTMRAMMERFPVHAVNGEQEFDVVKNSKSGQEIRRPRQSFVVEIPEAQPSLLTDTTMGPAQQVLPPAQQPRPAPRPGQGRLRGIGN